MDDRISREKEYHNKAFSEGIRSKVDKYYTVHKSSRRKLQQLLENYAKGKKVLEYGCGPGDNAFFLAQHAKKLVAIDISDYAIRTNIEMAQKEGVDNVEFLEMNAEALDFENESFDLVFGNAILHHLDIEKSYSELLRVLKPGGRVVFYEPLGHNFFINMYRKLTPQMRTEDEHPLLIEDIHLARKYFDQVNVRFYHLTTLLAVPFHNTFLFNGLRKLFFGVDMALFTVFPFLKRFAWYCIIDLKKK